MYSRFPIDPLSTSLEYFYRLREDQTKVVLEDHKGFLYKRGEEELKSVAWLPEKSLALTVTEKRISTVHFNCVIWTFITGIYPLMKNTISRISLTRVMRKLSQLRGLP